MTATVTTAGDEAARSGHGEMGLIKLISSVDTLSLSRTPTLSLFPLDMASSTAAMAGRSGEGGWRRGAGSSRVRISTLLLSPALSHSLIVPLGLGLAAGGGGSDHRRWSGGKRQGEVDDERRRGAVLVCVDRHEENRKRKKRTQQR